MSWPATIEHLIYGKGTQTAIQSQGVIKVHTAFDGAEMIEEYHPTSHELMTRRVRQKSALGGQGAWTTEVGEPVQALEPNKDFIVTSSSNPIFSRHDNTTHFIFRVRPIPYDLDTYLVTVAQTSQQIVIATTNKKYYKRIDIPEMAAIRKAATSSKTSQSNKPASDDNKMQDDAPQDGVLDPAALTWSWKDSTLSVKYTKPDVVLAVEAKYKAVLQRAK